MNFKGFGGFRFYSCVEGLARGEFGQFHNQNGIFGHVWPIFHCVECLVPFWSISIDKALCLWSILATLNGSKFKKGGFKNLWENQCTTLEWRNLRTLLQRFSNAHQTDLRKHVTKLWSTLELVCWPLEKSVQFCQHKLKTASAWTLWSNLSLVVLWVCSILVCIVLSNTMPMMYFQLVFVHLCWQTSFLMTMGHLQCSCPSSNPP